VADTRAAYSRWATADEELRRLTGNESVTAGRRELLQYQLEELETLDLGEGELARLEADHRRLANASRLIEGCGSVAGKLFDGDGCTAQLESARALLVELSRVDPELAAAAGLIEQAVVHLEEAEREIRRFDDAVEIDPARLREVEQRLETLHDLARKHGCGVDELAARMDRLAEELETLAANETRITELKHEIDRSLADYATAADGLHDRRAATATSMSAEISAHMRELGMPHAVFEAVVAVDERPVPTRHGYDRIEFLVSTNPDQAPRRLAKVASGGELSRISLSIQVATAGVSGVPVLVYDEVDAGVGGRVADILSRRLHELATRRQVLCITHLPQIASAGDHHFVVGKTLDDGVTQTEVRLLETDERVEELAKMLGGRHVSDKARAHARELLDRSAA
jgi:DNA repair protein RecN (Recombination protein N)